MAYITRFLTYQQWYLPHCTGVLLASDSYVLWSSPDL